MLKAIYSAQRQKRLWDAEPGVDAILIGDPRYVYYLSAFKPFWLHQAAIVLTSSGKSILFAGQKPGDAVAADDIRDIPAGDQPMRNKEQPQSTAELALKALQDLGIKSLGVDASAVSALVAVKWTGRAIPIDPILQQIRRVKHDDELALVRKAFACVNAMYHCAQKIIEPGIEEIRVFTELNMAAVTEAGEPLTALLGNDYACGVGGGPPRGGRRAKAGEIYILDVGPAYRGYFSDASRAFCVGGKPTQAQAKAHVAISACFPIVEKLARPGVRCRDIYQAVDQHLKSALGKGMVHHLGHGVGLEPHEFPHLNAASDDVLEEGEIFTAEPGVYGPDINGGIRLENTYRVTAEGLENLVNFPMEMA